MSGQVCPSPRTPGLKRSTGSASSPCSDPSRPNTALTEATSKGRDGDCIHAVPAAGYSNENQQTLNLHTTQAALVNMMFDPDDVPLSLSYYTVPELSPAETVQVAAETGCRYVGVRLLGGQPTGDLPPIMTDP